jgi:hypothetical protein
MDVVIFLHLIWSHVSGLMQFFDGPDKGMACVNKILCNLLVHGDKSWTCSYDHETKKQASQW